MNSLDALTSKPWLVTLLFCTVALILRVQIAGDAFWLDEIWSYYLSTLMQSPWDAFSELRIDNNHLLNTLFLYGLGEQPNWSVYRLPSLLSGVFTIALMGAAARKLDASPWLAMLLGTLSLPLIQYSAEARGYASATMFGLASWYIWFTQLAQRITPTWLLAFWASCVLGILSHLTFSIVLAALGIAGVWNAASAREEQARYLRDLGIAFSVPAIFTAWLYFYFYGRMNAGGAEPDWQLLPNLVELARVTLGAPHFPVVGIVAGLLLLALLGFGIVSMPATQRRFFILVILLVPGVLLTVYQPDYFYPRYLLVCLPFVYLVLARVLSCALGKRTPYRAAAGIFIVAIAVSSAGQYLDLAQRGKGDYPRAVADLFAANPADSFTVGSDFDFRNKALLDFYTRYRKDAKRMTYVEKSYESAKPVDFFIVHNLQQGHTPPRHIDLRSGRYRLMKAYPYAGLSGWNWYLYRYE